MCLRGNCIPDPGVNPKFWSLAMSLLSGNICETRGKLSHSFSAAGRYLLLLSVNTLFHVAEAFESKDAS